MLPLMFWVRSLPQLSFTEVMRFTRSRRSTVDDIMEPSQTSAMELRCQSSHVSMRDVTGTMKLRPLARQTLLDISLAHKSTPENLPSIKYK